MRIPLRRLPPRTATLVALACSGNALAATTVTIESWRVEDQAIWDEQILPVFEAAYPDIDVQFKPTAPTEYDAALNARMAGGTAGDIITCRPFDRALKLHQDGHLADIKDLPGLQENFSDVARAAWSTDDGSATFCVPMASVIHGFMYNADAFAELGLEVPETEEEFYAVLDAIAEDGGYVPMAMGTKDQWEAATMGYTNVGPTYWNGEEGRTGLISGDAKLTDDQFVEGFRQLEKWVPYLGDGYQAQGYTDSQNLFTLGRAAIYPTGSWEITGFQDNADFELGAFAPPKADADGTCVISDHTDIGIGMNPATEHEEAVRTFLEWTTGAEFASLLTNAAPGFFSLSNHLDRGREPAGGRVPRDARRLRIDDPRRRPDPRPRRAVAEQRAVDAVGERPQRHDDARGGGRAGAGEPRRVVHALRPTPPSPTADPSS